MNNSKAANLDICFNIYLPFPILASLLLSAAEAVDSIKFWKLRQHSTSLRSNVLVLVVIRELLQNRSHAAVGSHWLQQMQSFSSNPRIGILHQGFEQCIPHPGVA